MSQETKDGLQAIYAEAMRLQSAGDDDGALRLYAKLIDENPRIAEVHFQVARLFLKNDRLTRAMTHVKAAVSLRPKVHDIWRLWSEIVMILSDKSEQKLFLQKVKDAPLDDNQIRTLRASVTFSGTARIGLGKLSPETYRDIGNLIQARRFEDAEKKTRSALVLHSKVAALHDAMSLILNATGRHAEAKAASERAIRLDPKFAEARVNYARTLIHAKAAPDGVHQCNVALRLHPGLVTALVCRSECMSAMLHHQEAQEDLERALALAPKDERATYLLARTYFDEKDFFAARDLLMSTYRNIAKAPPAAVLLLAQIDSELGQNEAALEKYERLLGKAWDKASIHSRIAELKQTMGQFEEADAGFEKAISMDPDRGDIYRVFLTSKKLDANDPIIDTMKQKFEDTSISPFHRAQFGFALSKAYEDQKAYNKVFDYLHPANRIMRDTIVYDIDRRRQHDERVLDSMRSIDWAKAEPQSSSSFGPIFVTGMPRSGTTLVEQIIASHSRVTGAGEVGYAPKEALKVLGDAEGSIRPIAQVTTPEFEALADRFETYMSRLLPGADLVTDKSIQTYYFIGLLKMAMPNAKFVVVRRDPRDNLLSMYKNVFPEGAHLYAYDLKQLASFYKMFVKFVDYWRQERPDWFYEIQYEDLVSNPDEETRKLIAACGLEWEDQCLNFHQSDRRVKTLSLYQVRQPMYKTSTRSWERYGDALDELIDALGSEYLPEDA